MNKIKKTYRYINSFDIKNAWATILTIIFATILFGTIIYIGIIYTISNF